MGDDRAIRERRIIEVLPMVPELVWGRDETGTGDMWNSNSVVAWVLTRSGIDLDPLHPPTGGRAPGWNAGRIVAASDARTAQTHEATPTH